MFSGLYCPQHINCMVLNIGALSRESNWLPHSATKKGKVASHAIVKKQR